MLYPVMWYRVIEDLFGILHAKSISSRMKIKRTIAVNVDIIEIAIFISIYCEGNLRCRKG